MKITWFHRMFLLLALAGSLNATDRFQVYKGQSYSAFDWRDLNVERWNDFKLWKKELILKEKAGQWRLLFKQKSLREKFGRILSCVGDCRQHRGTSFSLAQYRTLIREGDELTTQKNSYAWVYLFDGSLLRLSPKTSVVFREFNISEDGFFVFFRVNKGHIEYINRQPNQLKSQKLNETDGLFLPLKIKKIFSRKAVADTLDEVNLSRFLEPASFISEQYEELNGVITSNNGLLKFRPTKSFIVFPNMTLYGEGFHLEAFHEFGGETHFRQKNSDWFLENEEEIKSVNQEHTLLYRGFNNKEETIVEVNKNYVMGKDGTDLRDDDEYFFSHSSLVTKRIPSILMAREKWLQKYSLFLLTEKYLTIELATKEGYRLWTGFEEGNELNKRINFLKSYTRRVETSQIRRVENLLVSQQTPPKIHEYLPNDYFEFALSLYAQKLDQAIFKR